MQFNGGPIPWNYRELLTKIGMLIGAVIIIYAVQTDSSHHIRVIPSSCIAFSGHIRILSSLQALENFLKHHFNFYFFYFALFKKFIFFPILIFSNTHFAIINFYFTQSWTFFMIFSHFYTLVIYRY